jgi:hypothetical protein
MADEPAYRVRVERVRLTVRARPRSFGAAPAPKSGGVSAIDAEIQKYVATMVRVDKVLAAFTTQTFAGVDMADCLPQAVDAFANLMNEHTLETTWKFRLVAGSMDYRDTGSGGHETTARVMATKGESTTTLTFEKDGQKNEVAVNIELAPISAGDSALSAGDSAASLS